jgi:hypothetical protein
MRALIKRGEKLTEKEKRLSSAYEWPVLTPDAVGRTKIVWELNRRQIAHEFDIDRTALRRRVKSRLGAALGKGAVLGEILRFTTEVNGLSVFTDIGYPTKGLGQFFYEQSVRDPSGPEPKMLLTHVSLFALLGAGQTRWSCMTEADVPTAVEALADFCVEFLHELPKIMEAARK